MSDLDGLFDKAIAEIERMINTKTVVGEPITVGDTTLIPLVSVGFGFGAGSGQGSDGGKGPQTGVGTGGGGGVKPVALVIIDGDGVRVEPIKGAAASLAEKIADAAARLSPSNREAGQRGP